MLLIGKYKVMDIDLGFGDDFLMKYTVLGLTNVIVELFGFLKNVSAKKGKENLSIIL